MFLYVFGLPFIMAPTSGWFTVPTVTIAALGYYGLDEVAEILESPFGEDPNDIHLHAFIEELIADLDYAYCTHDEICRVIKSEEVDEDMLLAQRHDQDVPALPKKLTR